MIEGERSLQPAPLMLGVDKDVYLRQLVPNDAEWLVAAVRDSRDYIGRTEPWALNIDVESERVRLSKAVAIAEAGQGVEYGIFVRRRLMGSIGLRAFYGNYAELGYWRVDDPEVRRKGVVTRSANQVVNMALTHMGLAAIGIQMRPDNVASRKVAERLGAQFLARNEQGLLTYIVTEVS